MQRFHEPTETAETAAPVYNSETVREVLARAAQIEAERQAEAPMNAEQIETLGRELGLSPDAVRRSLGEKIGVVAPVIAISHTATLPTMTRTDVLNAAKNAFAYSALASMAWIVYIVGMRYPEYFSSSPWLLYPAIILSLVAVIAVCFGWFVLPFVYAWRRKDWRQGMLLGAAIIPLYALGLGIASAVESIVIAPHNHYDWNFLCSIAPFAPIAGALGGIAGRWWDKLPRDAAANR